MNILKDKLLVVLVALLGLTVASFCLQVAPRLDSRWVGLAGLTIAFVKVRLIVVHYMEAERTGVLIRVAFEAWVWGTAGMVLGLY